VVTTLKGEGKMSKYLVQKMSYNNVDKCTDALNAVAKDNYEIIYCTAEDGKLIVVFEKRMGRPPKAK